MKIAQKNIIPICTMNKSIIFIIIFIPINFVLSCSHQAVQTEVPHVLVPFGYVLQECDQKTYTNFMDIINSSPEIVIEKYAGSYRKTSNKKTKEYAPLIEKIKHATHIYKYQISGDISFSPDEKNHYIILTSNGKKIIFDIDSTFFKFKNNDSLKSLSDLIKMNI